jgi:HAD superfamily hydrolase (TIGR01509 family)
VKKAVIFDLNGVFILSPKLSERFRETFNIEEERFLPALKEVMGHVRAPGAKGVFSYWWPHFQKWGLEIKEQQLLDFWFNAEQENVEMVALARELKEKGVRLFILSNNLRERSEYYNEHFPFLNELFDKQYYSWITGYIKPDMQGLKMVLKENDLQPEDCMFFDDSKTNVEEAQALGIEAYVFESADATREKLR